MTTTSFTSLNLSPDLLENLSSLGYHTMTPIQALSCPDILAGRDVIAQGKTGSGKTAAFGLGLLERLDVGRFRVQSLVLCPTRELADQVAQEIRVLGRRRHNIKVLTLCGGVAVGPQIDSLEHGAHIVVGTPGRIADHLERGTLRLDEVTMLVLDEADRMLEMGFEKSLDAIIDRTPTRRQTLLFSATYPSRIQAIARRILTEPIMAQVASTHDNRSIAQHFYRVTDDHQRQRALCLLLLQYQPVSTLVFCNTKVDTRQVAQGLQDSGFSVLALHGDLEQRDRDEVLARFSNKSISVLVATDVAARGLDIDSLDAVINYRIALEAEGHTHRVGRTGRAGSKGMAFSLYDEGEAHRVAALDTTVDPILDSEALPSLDLLERRPMVPPMATIQIDGGKKQKVRPGDILGALTGPDGIRGDQVGKIQVADQWAYVAVSRESAGAALKKLSVGKLKGRAFRVRLIN